MNAGYTILDIGCGIGQDARNLVHLCSPEGNVIGSDISFSVLSKARNDYAGHNISFCQMNGQYQAIKDNSCDAIREDRVLQHVINPKQIIREMFRILKPGGRCVLFEPDWGAFLVDGYGSSRITRDILDFWSDKFACGHIGRKLRRMCLSVGFTDLVVIPKTYIFTDLAEAESIFTLSENAKLVAISGIVTAGDAEEYIRFLCNRDKEGKFFCSFTGYLVSGKKPENIKNYRILQHFLIFNEVNIY
ncbi:methyltransferase domain-containing protein [Methanospirillum stamsii]|uniref:methyltransferase domain-containing protein n=1 Tax=Methanospirillum stamsii TaxID=1277351 RepID=UPI0024832A99|nr:methyltransferase domain-containing protein [Methanospirillum stamsii]